MTFVTEENITQVAEARWSTARDPRLRELLTKLVSYAHAYVREVKPTHEEWLAATEYVARLGQISDEKRKECILLSDVLGVSMLVVMLNSLKPEGATPDTVLGPFHIEGSPTLEHHAPLPGELPGDPLYVTGTVRGLDGAPVAGALLDIWQADEDGAYEAQLPDTGARLRGLQSTSADGSFGFWTIAPKGYAIPMDGPVGELIEKTDISYFRPAHIHFLISAPKHQPLITHLFRDGTDYLDSDVVFGARRELIVPFTRCPPGNAPDGSHVRQPFLTVEFNFVLAPAA